MLVKHRPCQGGVTRLFEIQPADIMAPGQETGRAAVASDFSHRIDCESSFLAVALEVRAERPRLPERAQDVCRIEPLVVNLIGGTRKRARGDLLYICK